MSIAMSEACRWGRRDIRQTARRVGLAGALTAAALMLAGCAGGLGGAGDAGPMGGGNADGQGNFGSTMETTTVAPSGGSSSGGSAPGQFADSEFTCPRVEVRGGASSWRVTDQADGGALRFQANLARFSRECRYSSPEMTMRVGIQGRVLLGAKGGATAMNVPIRVAVVEEGPTPKTVWTRLYMVPVQIGAEVLQVDFSMVAEEVAFPRPEPGVLERYVVYVGFDSQAGEAEARKPKPRQTAPRPAQAAAPRPTQPARQSAPPQQSAAPPAARQPAAPAAAAPKPVATQPPAAQPAPAGGGQWIGSAPTSTTAPAATSAARPPAAAANNPNGQWIGTPAPSSGGFMTPAQ